MTAAHRHTYTRTRSIATESNRLSLAVVCPFALRVTSHPLLIPFFMPGHYFIHVVTRKNRERLVDVFAFLKKQFLKFADTENKGVT